MDLHSRHTAELRESLKGLGWTRALDALDFAAHHHTGTRKNGIDPELSHPVGVALHVRTLPGLAYPEDTVAAALLHDVREDHGVTDETIRTAFGPLVADAVERMTKKFRGCRKDPQEYFGRIEECEIASVGKGADRFLNLGDMDGAFTPAKQAGYADEGEARFLPMLTAAEARFPLQASAYRDLRRAIRGRIQHVRARLAVAACA